MGKRVIVIGAGASGLAAACAASAGGAEVLLLEKNHVPGRKILSTGAGKCNLTNQTISLAHYHCGKPAFIRAVLKALPPAKAISFFEELGLVTRTESDGRIFPRSMKASDVVSVLVNRLKEAGADIHTLTRVESIKKTAGGFDVSARRIPPQWDKKSASGTFEAFTSDSLILAAGGPAYPQIGGSTLGLDLAAQVGHRVHPPAPVLVPLKVKGDPARELEGIRVDADFSITSEGKLLGKERGELLFTKYGVSGPVVLALSRAAVRAAEGAETRGHIDFFPDYSALKLSAFLKKRKKDMSGRSWRNFLCGLADERVLALVSARAGIDLGVSAGGVGEQPLSNFVRLLKDFDLELAGPLGFEDAMVAAGGVDTAEIDPATFESKLVKGLFITGEILDVDGDSGGYNLHFAWTSGLLAGAAAAK